MLRGFSIIPCNWVNFIPLKPKPLDSYPYTHVLLPSFRKVKERGREREREKIDIYPSAETQKENIEISILPYHMTHTYCHLSILKKNVSKKKRHTLCSIKII